MPSVSFHSSQTQDAQTGLRSPANMPVKQMEKQKGPGLPGNLDFSRPQEVLKNTVTLPSALPHRLLLKLVCGVLLFPIFKVCSSKSNASSSFQSNNAYSVDYTG